ncbi:hypothetical protein IAQ61_007904 [Plenodomus lingam]|uniref:uncharacterized protein n=1 Tax=Leptosphaeria maculans TaxID=5022 RepID=UPI00331B90F9|nr:hypothetical protein IAQ61_007904 [Plenodomus lingam]
MDQTKIPRLLALNTQTSQVPLETMLHLYTQNLIKPSYDHISRRHKNTNPDGPPPDSMDPHLPGMEFARE